MVALGHHYLYKIYEEEEEEEEEEGCKRVPFKAINKTFRSTLDHKDLLAY